MGRLAVLAVTGVCTAGLAACGGGDDEAFKGKSADEVAAQAVKATRQAESMHLKGSAQQKSGDSLTLDIAVDSEKNCEGTISQQGATAQVRHKSATLYLKGDEKYWRSSLKQQGDADKIVPKVAGKWVKMPAGDDQLTGLCDKQGLLAALDEDKSERKGMSKDGSASVDGTSAVKLTKKSGGKTLTMYVASEGKPYILKVTTTGGSAPESTTFSDYNKPVKPEQPPTGDTVDLKQLATQ
ncbi:hypothetical protein [Streptomyces sp. NBC_00687]|uniref:hypothetical protein n=1 Tax=Streptomyces sp. NBC_00687 TaxID=2975807 RepID=UPI00224E207B|nr:hypothetical protein [Streptomyces sp. NBC_00687]MCX4918698.1 hypothetical protein [Streptomyces sp. NBC_00687]